MNMSDASSGLDWLSFRQLDAQTDASLWGFSVQSGHFYHAFLAEGVYVLDEFGSDGNFFQRPAVYGGNRQGNPVKLEITAPAIFFVGAWRCVTSGGFFESSKFEILPATGLTEKAILGGILPSIEGHGWYEEIAAYHRSLS